MNKICIILNINDIDQNIISKESIYIDNNDIKNNQNINNIILKLNNKTIDNIIEDNDLYLYYYILKSMLGLDNLINIINIDSYINSLSLKCDLINVYNTLYHDKKNNNYNIINTYNIQICKYNI